MLYYCNQFSSFVQYTTLLEFLYRCQLHHYKMQMFVVFQNSSRYELIMCFHSRFHSNNIATCIEQKQSSELCHMSKSGLLLKHDSHLNFVICSIIDLLFVYGTTQKKSIKNVGTDISFLICRDLPASHKDWYTMLQNQRQTHNLEVKR